MKTDTPPTFFQEPHPIPLQARVLDGEDLETLSVTVDGEKGAFSVTPNALTIADVPDAFTLRSVVRIEGAGVNESILVVSGQERWQVWRRW